MFIAYPDLDKKYEYIIGGKNFQNKIVQTCVFCIENLLFLAFPWFSFFKILVDFPRFFYFARVEYKKQIFWLNLLIRQSTTVWNSQSAQIKQIRTFSAAGPNFFIPFLKILTAVLKCFSPSRFWVTGSFNTVISTLESREAPYRPNEYMGFEAWWC